MVASSTAFTAIEWCCQGVDVKIGRHMMPIVDRISRAERRLGELRPKTPAGMANDDEPLVHIQLDTGLYQLTVGMAWWFRLYAHEQTAEDRGHPEVAQVIRAALQRG